MVWKENHRSDSMESFPASMEYRDEDHSTDLLWDISFATLPKSFWWIF